MHDRLICTYQVEMEFKKNRQAVIAECFGGLKDSGGGISAPGFLSNSKTLEIIHRQKRDNEKRLKNLKDRITKVLANPTTNDPVYRVAQRMFASEAGFNLKREDSRKYRLRRAAWKRFVLGYPPRKKNDTSTGDAVNWEWIVECVGNSNRDLIIVSRDADYGVTIGGDSYLNDWLLQELRERTRMSRKVLLFDRLSMALRNIEIEVTIEEANAEDEAAKSKGDGSAWRYAVDEVWGSAVKEWIEEFGNKHPVEEKNK